MFEIDDGLKGFLASGLAVIVAGADARGRPQLMYGWGPLVGEDRSTLAVCLEQCRSQALLAAIEETGKIAVNFTSPVSYRSIQLKGTRRQVGDAQEEDVERVRRHRASFATETALVGDPQEIIRNTWLENEPLVRVEFAIESAFDQTPGPHAGTKL